MSSHSVSFDVLMPIFLSEPQRHDQSILPFMFTGGFGFSTRAIGIMMAVQAVYAMIAQLWLFPFVIRRLGPLKAFRMVVWVWPLLCVIVPYLSLLPGHAQIAGIYITLFVKMTLHVIAFPSNAILLAEAAQSKSVRGTINGGAAAAACFARAVGPFVTGSIHARGLADGCGGLAWWAMGIVAAVGSVQGLLMSQVGTI